MRAVAAHDAAGNPDDRRVRRHGMDHHRAGADAAAVADGHRPEHGRPGRDDDEVLDRRMALAFVGARPAERDALVQRDVVTDLRRLADHDPHAVIDEDAPADRRRGVDVDAGQEAAQVADDPRRELDAATPEPVRHAIQHERVHAGIRQHHLEARTRRGVALEDDLDVLLEMLPGRARHQLSPPPRATRAALVAASSSGAAALDAFRAAAARARPSL